MGNLYLAARDFKRAQDRAQMVLNEDPANVEAHVLMANADAGLQEWWNKVFKG